MIKWFKRLWAWKRVRSSGVWHYEENSITGERMAIKYNRCYQPVDREWLKAGTAYTIIGEGQ